MGVNELRGEPTKDPETMLENMRKSRDEFKEQAATLRNTVGVQSKYIEEQREQIGKLIEAVCLLSKAVKR